MRAVIGPNGAGKTTMMDIITGKTRPDRGDVIFDQTVDLTRHDEAAIAQLGIGRKFQRPTVFETHTVFDNLLLSLADPRGVMRTLLGAADRGRARADRRAARDRAPRRPARRSGGGAQPWPEAVARDRHAAGAGSQAAAGRRAGRRDDRRRDHADGRAAEAPRRRAHDHRRRARHGVRARARDARSPCCTRATCWPKARSTMSAATPRSSAVYLGR